jgi:Tat protein translocase TatB subunit
LYLFIFESIGTSELLLIGVVALMFLGPRRMPEMARKLGKIMSEFRGTANEFKETWQREVDFEEEKKAFDIESIENEPAAPAKPIAAPDIASEVPTVKPVDPVRLEELKAAQENPPEVKEAPPPLVVDDSDKQNWL